MLGSYTFIIESCIISQAKRLKLLQQARKEGNVSAEKLKEEEFVLNGLIKDLQWAISDLDYSKADLSIALRIPIEDCVEVEIPTDSEGKLQLIPGVNPIPSVGTPWSIGPLHSPEAVSAEEFITRDALHRMTEGEAD